MFVFKAAVVGAGTMGGEIAQVVASAGIPVVLKDVKQEFVDTGLEKARQVTEAQLGSLVKKEKITQEDADRQKEEILGRIRRIEAENDDFATRYVEIEEENNNLANLYIASYQLHSTLDFRDVLRIINEIVINLIGAEEFAIMLLDEKAGVLSTVSAEGVSAEELAPVPFGEGLIGTIASTGNSYFVEDLASYACDRERPMVCIPLKIKDHVIGVIAIYRLLVQKRAFAQVDYELFTLLAGHAATAIFSSRLYGDSERKLSTMQGLINLLTK
jgi:GAF domain-containing protein